MKIKLKKQKKINLNLTLSKVLKKFWWQNLIILFTKTLMSALVSLETLSIAYLIQYLSTDDKLFWIWFTVFVSSFVTYTIIRFFYNKYEYILIKKQAAFIASEIGKEISLLSYEEFYSKNIGNYLSWFNTDLKTIEESGLTKIYSFFSNVTSFMASLISLSILNWILALIVLGMVIISFLIPQLISKYSQKVRLNYSKTLEKTNARLLKTLKVFKVFNIWGLNDIFFKLIYKEVKSSTDAEKNFIKKYTLVFFTASMLIILSTITSLVISIVFVYYELLFVGALISVFSLCSLVFNQGLNFVFEYVEVKSTKTIFAKIFTPFSEKNKDIKKIDFLPKFASLNIKNLNFSYEKDSDKTSKIIKDFNFNFLKNKKYAIVAQSGVGKSTLLKIFSGSIKSYSGNVLWNNSLELNQIEDDLLREKISYLDNQNIILNDSFENNICLWKEDPKKLEKVIEKLNIKSLKNNFKDNLPKLSEGQKQKIIFARMLFEDKEIILMDEALDNIDQNYRKFLKDLIFTLEDKTFIMVSHHLGDDWKNQFDEIIYL